MFDVIIIGVVFMMLISFFAFVPAMLTKRLVKNYFPLYQKDRERFFWYINKQEDCFKRKEQLEKNILSLQTEKRFLNEKDFDVINKSITKLKAEYSVILQEYLDIQNKTEMQVKCFYLLYPFAKPFNFELYKYEPLDVHELSYKKVKKELDKQKQMKYNKREEKK